MERSYGRCTAQAQDYIRRASDRLSTMSPAEIAARTAEIVARHDDWRFHEAISLNAAENVMSASARKLLDSDMATRVTEGFPGHKDFPADRQNRFVDEIEASIIYQLRTLFKAKHVEWRPVSTSMANATVFFALLNPGDDILVQPEMAGGNYSYNPNGPPRAAHLNVHTLPFDDVTFELKVDEAVDRILAVKPKMIVVGGSNVMFPYPLEEIRKAADEVGAKILYDAAHTALYLATGLFQDPLREGADLLTFSTHKLMSGAVGGVIATNDDALGEKILEYSFPTLIQTRDQNKYAATAHALAEMSAFGRDYALATIETAKALALALEDEGFELLCRNRGYTQTHQIFAFIPDSVADTFEDRCQQANLLLSRAQRMGAANRAAVRLTTQELARRGVGPKEMTVLARWLRQLIIERADPARIANEVREFLTGYPRLVFSFDR